MRDQLFINSVWEIDKNLLAFQGGCFRVLAIYPEIDKIILYKMDSEQTKKPFGRPLSDFEVGIEIGQITKSRYELDDLKSLGEDELPEHWKSRRKKKYEYIKNLVEDPTFLDRITSGKKCADILNEAKLWKVTPNTIYRVLHEYWRYGQTIQALNPRIGNCGSPGKSKPKDSKSGRPVKSSVFGFEFRKTIKVNDEIRKQIKNIVNEYYIAGNVDSVGSLYSQYLTTYESEEITVIPPFLTEVKGGKLSS